MRPCGATLGLRLRQWREADAHSAADAPEGLKFTLVTPEAEWQLQNQAPVIGGQKARCGLGDSRGLFRLPV